MVFVSILLAQCGVFWGFYECLLSLIFTTYYATTPAHTRQT